MPQLEEGLWIEGGYYVDFDEREQLRIIGPNNHLYMGLIDIPRHKIKLKNVKAEGATVKVTGNFTTSEINFYQPAMDDMRTIRDLTTHPHGHKLTFLELRRTNPTESVPMYVRRSQKQKRTHLLFQRTYGESWYRSVWEFGSDVSIRAINHPYKGYKLSVKAKKGKFIPFVIHAETNDFTEAPCTCRMLPMDTIDWNVFGKDAPMVERFWFRTQLEVDHLISWRKTSGDRFGTIFPRDWMESILLGEGDVQPETVDQMLAECLAHVDNKGRGWHEDLVGEYKYEHELAGKDIYDRKMIDIEPLYFLCLDYTSPAFWKDEKSMKRLKRVAKYITKKASTQAAITFKKHSRNYQQTRGTMYHRVGDWRDSTWAYKQINEIIAPYSVNVSHYPLALRVILKYAKRFGLNQVRLKQLVKKWDQTKKYFHFENKKDSSCYALALYDIQKKKTFEYKKMKVCHLDEAYTYALTEGTEQELKHFANLLVSPKGFYTPSGPIIVARENTYGYTTQEYHGLVTWTKQAAFAIKALAKHRILAEQKSWSKKTTKLLDDALEKTCASLLSAFISLNAVPELHYDKDGVTHFFTDQSSTLGSMSKVQLWSAVGYRRIIREYHDFLKEKRVNKKNT